MSKTINTRLKLKYDTLANWTSVASTFIPLKGEMCVVEIPSGDTTGTATNPPTIMFKVGDGTSTFAKLPWCSGRASDVYSWAKNSTKPSYTADEIKISSTGTNTVGESISSIRSTLGSIQTDLNDEIEDRKNGDTNTLSSAKTYADGKVSSEATTRANADTALDNKITALQTSISNIKPFSYEVVSTLPTASASTMYKIYLVADTHSDSNDSYDEYITLQSGTTYSWEKIGNTDVNLSDYVKTVSQSGTTGVVTSVTKSGNTITVTGTNLSQTKNVTSGKYITAITQDAQGKISITESNLPTDNNQTIKGNGTAFGTNDAINIAPGTNITVTADTTNKKITIAGKSDADIKSLAETQINTHSGVDKTGTVESIEIKGNDYLGVSGGNMYSVTNNSATVTSSGTIRLSVSTKVVTTDDQIIIDCGSSTTNTF